MARNIGATNTNMFKDWLSKQKATIPEMPDVEKVTDRVVRVLGGNPGEMQLQGTNTYLIGTGSRRILLDSGEGMASWAENITGYLRDHKIELAYVLLSHWHGDHTGGVPDLLAYDPSLEDRIYKHTPDAGQRPIRDDQVFKVEGATVRALFTPGHSIDHMCFVLEEENALFTGDNVLGHGFSVEEDLGEYHRSLCKMRDQGCALGYPAHGTVIANLLAKMDMYIRRKEQRERSVVDTLRRRSDTGLPGHTVKEVVRALHGDINSEVAAQGIEPNIAQVLKKLAEDRRVGFTNVKGSRRWFLKDCGSALKSSLIRAVA
ncbi:hypothetical protein PG995_012263 [Apiospora arundinis]